MYEFFAIVNTEGSLKFSEIQDECHKENWSPVLVLRYADRIVVPLFKNHDTAIKFIRRNIPRNQIVGVLGMSNEDIGVFDEFEIEWHNFPRKYKDRKDMEISVEVIQLENGFDLFASKGRPK